MAEVFKLKKPIEIDGAEVTELPYDFEAMTARDMLRASRNMAASGNNTVAVEEFDPTYHLFLFAAAVYVGSSKKIEFTDVLRISALDAKKAGGLARSFFFLGQDLDGTVAPESSER